MRETSQNPYIASAKFNRKAIQVSEAQKRAHSLVGSARIEKVPIHEANGRFLAEDVFAPHPYPFFRRSGMDGYAIRCEDVEQASSNQVIWLKVIDDIPCGYASDMILTETTAARIMTGAMVPEGADAVVMLEATESRTEGGTSWVGIKRPMDQGANITPVGFEVRPDELLLRQGTRITAGELSVLATFGIHQVPVFSKPIVAVFATGTELLRVDEPLQPGKIRNSNTIMLASQIEQAGGIAVVQDSVPDDIELARQRLDQAIQEYDFIVTSGGVSVGDYDIMGDLVRRPEVDMLFNKVTMRPGSVTTAAVVQGKLLFALSGNPGACYVGFELFVRPAIRKMLGDQQPYLETWTATLRQDFNKVNNFTRFVRSRLEIEDGRVWVTPAAIDESSVMVSIKDSDCLMIVPPEQKGLQAGTQVQVLKLER
ncbi:molybdopterin molybdotransferase MoeA [Paenibacillus sp. JX-17]|uniref:Molybdopterin molybdenumtransferase n=1 Tax=Paenibacillus lacisoli TaxID=3064525 RepID=A0ABT9C6J0_9BACL|nr:gephyrin-like molybdotransferase Glp [Paenibacillus sp. JX-17]MDO7904874.1 molybdopterin molybdotransferase MoeA [Paenibacillus sp. JX-17]